MIPPQSDALRNGRLLLIAPHMDDEILGCGGLMLLHRDRHQIHCIYATGGERSPAPLLPWQGRPPRNLIDIRTAESENVLTDIGVPRENVTYLNLPDGRLSRSRAELRRRLELQITTVQPDFVLVPFRYDLHADHVAVHRAVRELARLGRLRAPMLEYFVYVRWQFAGEADIRRRVRADQLVTLDITSVAARKEAVLSLYRSQTTTLYPWQESPVLTADRVTARSREPEQFLIADPGEPLRACFIGGANRLVLAHHAYRLGKRRKDQLRAIARSVGSQLRSGQQSKR